MESTPLWERVKENAAPLERGRNVSVLERSFAAETESSRSEKEQMVLHYERLVQPSEATDFSIQHDDDPLVHWLSYIKFHQEAFPSDTHAQFLLFERCMRAMCRLRKYANDTRFVRVCCMYAEQTDRPSEVFQHLYAQKIGSETAMFWMAWGFVAEKQQNYSFAEQIFEKGIRKKAQPLEKLVQRHRQFQRRMTRYWLNSIQDQQEDDEDSRPRGVLGALSEDSLRRNDRSRVGGRPAAAATLSTFTDRSAHSRTRQSQGSSVLNKGNGSFAIFVDSRGAENAGGHLLDDSLVSFHDRQLERDQERKKENTLEAERWNSRGGLSSSYAQAPPARAPSPTPFAVYVDEECAAEHKREEEEQRRHAEYHRRQRDERTFRERGDTTVAERLAKDPLRYVRDPSQLESDQAAAAYEHQRRDERHSRKDCKKRSANIAFNSRLLKDSTGREQCFQEARSQARFYKLAPPSTNLNLLCARKPQRLDDSCMSMDESTDYTNDASMENAEVAPNVRPPTKEGSSRKSRPSLKPFSVRPVPRPESSFEAPTPRNASTASSTVDEANAVGLPARRDEQTINTQLALKELSMMFSSPALGLNDSSTMPPNRAGGLGPILNESGISEQAAGDNDDTAADSEVANINHDDGETADFESIVDLIGDSEPNGSFTARTNEGTSDPENKGEHNPSPRSNATPGFEDMALKTLREEQSGGGTGCGSTQRRVIGTIAQSDDPLRDVQERDLETDPGFTVYDETKDTDESRHAQRARPVEDESRAAFQIYQDSSTSNTRQSLQGGSANNDEGRQSNGSTGDTATFSLFGDAMQALTDISQSNDDGMTFDLKDTDEPFDSKSSKRHRFNSIESDVPAFGDISHIVPLDDPTVTIGPEVSEATRRAVQYSKLHPRTKIKMNKDKRWMPEDCFHRYHNAPLWSDIFETLLNLEEGTKVAIGSRPRSLRQLRRRIEEYLSEDRQSRKLKSSLRRQAAMLPKMRLT